MATRLPRDFRLRKMVWYAVHFIYRYFVCIIDFYIVLDVIDSLFSGIVPRMIGEILTIWMANMLGHAINLIIQPSAAKVMRSIKLTNDYNIIFNMNVRLLELDAFR